MRSRRGEARLILAPLRHKKQFTDVEEHNDRIVNYQQKSKNEYIVYASALIDPLGSH